MGHIKYSKGQILPINMEGFMGINIPCDAKIVDIQYVVRAEFNNGQFTEMSLNEEQLQERIIGNPEPIYKGKELTYYQPSCPHGYSDCILDPMYTREHYPDTYKERGCPTKCTENCEDGEWYDDEDK